jgi:hypothetical protein
LAGKRKPNSFWITGFKVAFDVDGGAPEFYVLEGDLDTLLAVEPVTYRARPA